MASQYDIKEWQKVVLNYITSQLQEHTDFFGIEKDQASGKKPNIRFLDYACGTGNVSKVCVCLRNFCVCGEFWIPSLFTVETVTRLNFLSFRLYVPS
jgi:hypothetical protein